MRISCLIILCASSLACASDPPKVGDEIALPSQSPVAISYDALASLKKRIAAKDKEGIDDLVEKKTVVLLDAKTTVRIIEITTDGTHIRALDGAHARKEFYILYPFLRGKK